MTGDFTTMTTWSIVGIFLLTLLVLWQLAWFGWRVGYGTLVRLAGRLPGANWWKRTHPARALLERRWPRLARFVERRLDPTRFSGLLLTVMSLVGAYLMFLFSGIVRRVVTAADEITALDESISETLAFARTPELIAVFRWLTGLGAVPALTALSIVASGFLWASRRLHRIPALWITIVGSHAITYIGKYVFDRQRPEFADDLTVYTASFPSAHATASIAVYGFLAYAIARELPRVRERFEVVFWTSVLILLIGFSRIFLNVHHASDVAAGFLVGAFWLLVGVAVSEILRVRGIPAHKPGEKPVEREEMADVEARERA